MRCKFSNPSFPEHGVSFWDDGQDPPSAEPDEDGYVEELPWQIQRRAAHQYATTGAISTEDYVDLVGYQGAISFGPSGIDPDDMRKMLEWYAERRRFKKKRWLAARNGSFVGPSE